MKNFAKKLSALLLALAMVLTMMPMIAAPAFAEGDEASGTAVYTVSLNGEKICDLTAEWMEDNSYEPQIFPNITKKGISYVVAQGPAIDDVLCYAFGETYVSDIPSATVSILPSKKNPISGKDLADAVTVTKPVDENGQDVSFGDAENVFVTKLEGAPDVTPIIAIAESEKFSTYAAAQAAMDGENWVKSNGVEPYYGGNLNKDLQIKKDGTALDESVNFTGKFVITGGTGIDISLTAPSEPVKKEINMTVGDPALVVEPDLALTMQEIRLLYGDDFGILWDIVGGSGAVDFAPDNADIVAVKAGKATVTASIFKPEDDSFEPIVINEWNITVAGKAAPAPAITDGQVANVGGSDYQVTSAAAKTAALTKAPNKKSATVPATVVINGQTLEVTSIAPNAFKGTKVKTLTVKSKKLTKASVKNSLKGSKVKTVKVKVGKKKDNKKFVKKYKKIFTKKNAGKKVKVK